MISLIHNGAITGDSMKERVLWCSAMCSISDEIFIYIFISFKVNACLSDLKLYEIDIPVIIPSVWFCNDCEVCWSYVHNSEAVSALYSIFVGINHRLISFEI